MSQRIHNFNPGPSAFPLSVLEQIQAELSDYQGSDVYLILFYPVILSKILLNK
jgi:phosphoserine aminotransferase